MPSRSEAAAGDQIQLHVNGRLIVKPGHDAQDNPPILPDPYLRKITTFREPSRDIVFAEENTSLGRPTPLNDAFFIYSDMTDARHTRASEVGYLDGHADEIPANISLYNNRKYYCR